MASVLKAPENAEGWEFKYIPHFTDGLNVQVRDEDIKDTNLVISQNIRFEKNRVLIDYGYKKFGAVLRGNVRATFQFFKKDGTSILTAITNLSFYEWRVNASQWVYVSNGTSTTLTAGEPTSETSMAVGSISGFSDNDTIGIELDDGTQHITAVNGAPSGSIIIIDDGLPSAAAAGKVLLKSVDLTGVDGTPVGIEVYTPSDWMVFTNGTDTPQKFDGTTCEDVPNLPGSTFTALVVAVFKDYLIFLRTVEDGTEHPQRQRWSDTGDGGNWTTGNSGFQDLFESEDFIVTALKLGPYLIVYKERSIVRVEHVGLLNEIFHFPVVVSVEGAKSLDSVVDLGDQHLMFGNANIFSYKGGFNLDVIGDPIYHKVFSTKGELNPSQSNRVQGIYIEELGEIWYFYPSGEDDSPKNMLRYVIRDKSFSERKWPLGLTGLGLYTSEAFKAWNDLVGDWDVQSYFWVSGVTLANAPTTQLCFGTQVMEYDYLEVSDDGTVIEYIMETADFYIPRFFIKIDYIEVMLKGIVEVLYSIDEGISYRTMGTIGPGSNFERFRIFEQFVARKVRFRLKGNSTSFGIESFGFSYALESEW